MEGKQTMKKSIILLTALLVGTAAVHAAEVSLTADIASAYVFRGVTLNDGFVVQPGMEVSGLPIPLTIGVWGNIDGDDYDGTLQKGQFSEIDLYASYDVEVGMFGLGAGYCEYTYPQGGEADREFSIYAGADVLLAPAIAVYYGVGGAIEKSLYVEAEIGHSFEPMEEMSIDLGATIAYSDPDEGEDGFSNYTATLGVSYYFVGASVTYIGQIDDDVLPDGKGAYDTEVVGMLSLGYDF
jgi:uncharacterized protein (TIGR02001 family)